MQNPLPRSPSPLRVASNLLVIILVLACVAYAIDAAMVWFGKPPYFSCNVLPVWQAISDPWPLVMAVALVLWFGTGFRSRLGLLVFLMGVMFGVAPWAIAEFVNPICP